MDKEIKTVAANGRDGLASAYERLHKDYLYLERDYYALLAQKEETERTLLAQKEEAERALLEQKKEAECALLAQKKEAERTLLAQKEEAERALLEQKKEAECALLEKDVKIWRMQIENERCKAQKAT